MVLLIVLFSPNTTDRRRVSDQFRTHENNVMVIPHIKDVRNWYEMSSQTRDFIDANPKLLTAEMIQIYPASSDRLSAKGVEVLIDIWAAWKKHSITGVLVIANQWATGKARKEDIQKYKDMALEKGLEKDEFVFTSEHSHILRNGIPARMLRELQALQNVFIFPTREESFGLVGPEAAMSGCLMILNSSLDMMKEIFMSRGLFFEFGSFHRTMQYPGDDPSAYLEAVAMTVFNKYLMDPSICTKSLVRQRYNMDSIYQQSYLPVMHNLSITASGVDVDQEKLEESMKAMEVFKKEYMDELEKQKEEKDGE
jgi:glycosyltransferase involved in cell wall biosynthesis